RRRQIPRAARGRPGRSPSRRLSWRPESTPCRPTCSGRSEGPRRSRDSHTDSGRSSKAPFSTRHLSLVTSSRLQLHQLAWPRRETSGSRSGPHRVVIFNPHAELSRHVDSRLDRLDISGDERLLVASDEVWWLVAVHAEAMAEPMCEERAVAG